MNTDFEVSIQQEITTVRMGKPHVVVLGAGASRACCLRGEKNGKSLPVMNDFAETVGLTEFLTANGIDPNQNFEEIFSGLHEKGRIDEIKVIENIVEDYFRYLVLPDQPTIYDHLVLSLRETDIIATFNWDPLLMQAYIRNRKAGLELPSMLFLHGNIAVGYCPEHDVKGRMGARCKKCGKPFLRSPLLYPIKKKDYASDFFISKEWEALKWGFKNAFMITIYGYSGPKTDQEAIAAMHEAWGNKEQRFMEQTAFISIQSEDEIRENWEPFIHTHHWERQDNFYDSWIAHHPRRTGEAYLNQYFDAKFIDNNPIPLGLDFPALWDWYGQFKAPEEIYRAKAT